MNERHIVKVGTLMRITHGEYSSWTERGWFVAVQEFCPEDELAAYLEAHPDQRGHYSFKDEAFFGWFHSKGYLAECHVFFDDWYLGDYGNHDLVQYSPRVPGEAQPLRDSGLIPSK